jgi:hypothetical protein
MLKGTLNTKQIKYTSSGLKVFRLLLEPKVVYFICLLFKVPLRMVQLTNQSMLGLLKVFSKAFHFNFCAQVGVKNFILLLCEN